METLFFFEQFRTVNHPLESDFFYTSSFMFQLFCDTEVDHCREWNSNRQEKGEPAYDSNM